MTRSPNPAIRIRSTFRLAAGLAGGALVGNVTGLAGCDDPAGLVVVPRCESDHACATQELCLNGLCTPRTEIACNETKEGPILQPSVPSVDFGSVGRNPSERPLVLRNIGDCTLSVFEAFFEKEEQSPFACPPCAPEHFPLEIFPFRDYALMLSFTPESIGAYADTLVLLSDDSEFSEIRIPIRARFDGIAKPAIAPNPIEFDYAPVGRTVARSVRITNLGTGRASLDISALEIQTATASAFSLAVPFVEPVKLEPISVDRDATLLVDLRYHPREVATHTGDLVLVTNAPDQPTIRVPLRGSSKTPAKISVAPEQIQFGPVPLGQTTSLPLTVINEGGTPLRMTYRWTGTGLSTDLFASPRVVPAILPGSLAEMQVLITATAPSPVNGLLLIETNDPSRPAVTVPVSAEGQEVAGAQVVKIDMIFENGADSAFDDDFRNVDMSLEDPFGRVCNKDHPEPTHWGAFGNPFWTAFGPKEEPERIVLPNAGQDGTYRVFLTYQEDCSSVPTALVASLLGVSIDVLLLALTQGGIPGISGDRIADVISDVCFSRSGSSVTVTVTVNGAIVAETPVTLGHKGDFVYAVDLVRSGGQFSVEP